MSRLFCNHGHTVLEFSTQHVVLELGIYFPVSPVTLEALYRQYLICLLVLKKQAQILAHIRHSING